MGDGQNLSSPLGSSVGFGQHIHGAHSGGMGHVVHRLLGRRLTEFSGEGHGYVFGEIPWLRGETHTAVSPSSRGVDPSA